MHWRRGNSNVHIQVAAILTMSKVAEKYVCAWNHKPKMTISRSRNFARQTGSMWQRAACRRGQALFPCGAVSRRCWGRMPWRRTGNSKWCRMLATPVRCWWEAERSSGGRQAIPGFQACEPEAQHTKSDYTPEKRGKVPIQEASFSEGSSGGIVLLRRIQCDLPKKNRLRAIPTDLLIYKPAKKCGHKETEGKTLGWLNTFPFSENNNFLGVAMLQSSNVSFHTGLMLLQSFIACDFAKQRCWIPDTAQNGPPNQHPQIFVQADLHDHWGSF